MQNLNLDGIHPEAAQRLRPFAEAVTSAMQERIVGIYLTGSALSEDFNPKSSDVNTVIVFNRIALDTLDSLAKLGTRFGRKGISAPLVLGLDNIKSSLDVFPIEFLEMKLMHRCVCGDDVLADLEIDRRNLRLQCERELKGMYINLRQDYIRAGESPVFLKTALVGAFSGIMPILRALLHLYARPIPADSPQTFTTIEDLLGMKLEIMREISEMKRRDLRMDIGHLRRLSITFHDWLGKLADMVDQMNVQMGDSPGART